MLAFGQLEIIRFTCHLNRFNHTYYYPESPRVRCASVDNFIILYTDMAIINPLPLTIQSYTTEYCTSRNNINYEKGRHIDRS